MDRLISEQAVLDVINEAISLGRIVCGKERTIEEIKAIPSAEPKIVPIANIHFDEDKMREVCKEVAENIVVEYDFKGMTNGEVIKAVFPDIPRTLEWHIQNVTDDDWWNSPYSEEGSD